MTFKEYMQISKPSKVNDNFIGGVYGCPHEYQLEDFETSMKNCAINGKGCEFCWNREMPSKDENQSAKADAGKIRPTLVPMSLIRAVAAVREFGTKKYKDPENWRRVEPQRYKDALMRHLIAYLEDEDSVDEESGLSHLDHAACNIAFLIELRKNGGN